MSVSGPSVIVNPTPATGLRVRRPRCEVWVDGYLIPNALEVSSTRGLDQPMATADIVVPHPLADRVKYWSKVQIIAGVPPTNLSIGQAGMVVRFTGYITNIGQQLYPSGKTIHCDDILAIAANSFTPEEMDIGSFNDAAAVREILFGCKYHEATFQPIHAINSGTNTFLVDIEEAQLFWELGETGLEKIQDIDSVSLGWRTYATAGGLITRTEIAVDPNKVGHVWHFGEGVDILEGSTTVEIVSPKNEIMVTGFDGSVVATLDPEDDPFDWNRNSYWIRWQQLRTQAVSAGIINPTDIALYILSQISKPLIKVTFTTHLDIHFQGQEVIKVTSERLEVDQKFWVQSVQFNCGADGSWSQTITGISHLQPYNRHMVIPPIDTTPSDGDVSPGDDLPYPELPPETPIGPGDFLIDFTIEVVDREFGGDPLDTSDTGGGRYVVVVTDTSTSTTSLEFDRAWLAAGTGLVGPASPVEGPFPQSFTTFFNDLVDATITLTLDPGGANEVSLTQAIDATAVTVRSRMLFALTPTTYEAFNGTEWKQYTPVGHGQVAVVGGGAYWGTNEGWFAYSADGLATPPTEFDVTDDAITAIWVHETQVGHVVIGTDDGALYVSTDHGITWPLTNARDGPGGIAEGNIIRQVIVSIHNVNQWHVLTPTGWYISQDAGTTWSSVRAGNFLYLELSHSRNIIVTFDGQLQKAEDGTPFTRPDETSPIVAATSHIRADAFYAIAADGTTWVTQEEGSYALVAGEPIPDGSVLTSGAYRDGQAIDVVYFAAQDGGIFKTTDGFRSAAGYLRLRNGDSTLLTP